MSHDKEQIYLYSLIVAQDEIEFDAPALYPNPLPLPSTSYFLLSTLYLLPYPLSYIFFNVFFLTNDIYVCVCVCVCQVRSRRSAV